MSTYVLELEGSRRVSIEEREGGLMISETKLDMKRKTTKDRWIARANCPGEKVQLGRMAEIETLLKQGYALTEGPDTGPPTTAPPDTSAIAYFRGAQKGVSALRDAVRRPESIPGIHFTSGSDGWVLLDDERDPLESSPYLDRMAIPDEGGKAIVCWTRKGTAMYGVLLALAQDGHGTLAMEGVGAPVTMLLSNALALEIKQSTGNTRGSLEAMGVIEPPLRNYATAIGSVQHDHLVL